MATQGPFVPSTVVNDSSNGGSFNWFDQGSGLVAALAAADGADYAWNDSLPGFHSVNLKCTNFGFSIPAGATIDGILATIRKKEQASSSNIFDYQVRIVKGGTPGATERKIVAEWPTAFADRLHGGATDLWGETWTPADINASAFGVAISSLTSVNAQNASIDRIQITVYYTLASQVLGTLLNTGLVEGSALGTSLNTRVVAGAALGTKLNTDLV